MAPGSYIQLFMSALILLESQNMIELFWMYWLSGFARHDSGGFTRPLGCNDNSQPSAF